MKRLILTVAMGLPLYLYAGVYTVPLAGDFNFNMLGSQFAVGELVSTYSGFIPGGPLDGDEVLFWNVAAQDFDPIIPTYSAFAHAWIPNPALPLGTAFFYVRTGVGNTTITRVSAIPPPFPAPVALAPNKYYALSSQTPTAATYQDLVGAPAAVPNPQTFVWPFDVPTQDLGSPYRYAHGVWVPSPPLIPVGLGAFVVWYAPGDAPPALQTVGVSGADCPPLATLTLTFSGGSVDPVSAATPANYKVYYAGGFVPGGLVLSATPTFVGGSLAKTVQNVVLQVSLPTEPGDLFGTGYLIDAFGVTSLGGTPASPSRLPFTLCSGAPSNDDVSGAIPLTSGVTAYGSLKCATHTLLSVSGVPQYPAYSSDAKDVWYSFSPAVSGNVTVDTCRALSSGCPQSSTVLAIYVGYPGAPLNKVTGTWYGSNMGASCPMNPNAAQVQFAAEACATYYIRVSTWDLGALPGDFALNLVLTPAPPANNPCSGKQTVSANSSTRFDNFNATTDGPATESVFNDVWFHFQAPSPGASPVTTVDTCTANFNTALAVYADNGNCPPLSGDLVAFNAGFCGMGSQVTFSAIPGQGYFVRVGGRSSTDLGCGALHVSSTLPPAGTLPGPGGFNQKVYNIFGSPNNVGWTWSLTAPPPCNLNMQDSVPGVPTGGVALDIAQAFANSITSHSPLVAIALDLVPPTPNGASLYVYTPCSASDLVLKVDSSLPPACWVDFDVLTVGFTPCSFNPVIYEVGDPNGLNTDCNANGRADYLDILLGISQDANGNGVPDECEGCVRAVVAGGPVSAIAYLGGPAAFSVQVLGTSPFSYQWRKNGSPLPNQTNATLVLTNVALSAAGLYDAVVSNACGSATSGQASLQVSLQPWLNAARDGANIVLSWSAPNYQLQATPALGSSANWTNIPGASPLTLPASERARFFRLQAGP